MYLVELKPGKEELYRTGDELALAIRDGDVDSRSRIYHRATAKWISITLHPQYKAIVAGQKDEQAPRPARKAWGLLPTSHNGVSEERTPTETAPSNGTIRACCFCLVCSSPFPDRGRRGRAGVSQWRLPGPRSG